MTAKVDTFSIWDDDAECYSDVDSGYEWHDAESNCDYDGVMMAIVMIEV